MSYMDDTFEIFYISSPQLRGAFDLVADLNNLDYKLTYSDPAGSHTNSSPYFCHDCLWRLNVIEPLAAQLVKEPACSKISGTSLQLCVRLSAQMFMKGDRLGSGTAKNTTSNKTCILIVHSTDSLVSQLAYRNAYVWRDITMHKADFLQPLRRLPSSGKVPAKTVLFAYYPRHHRRSWQHSSTPSFNSNNTAKALAHVQNSQLCVTSAAKCVG
jgi:hypothetical protein